MLYVVIGFSVFGLAMVATAGRRVPPEPVCPNCRERLENITVERCPHCLLWQPPEVSQPTRRWNWGRVTLGLLAAILPLCVWLLSSVPGSFSKVGKPTTSAPGVLAPPLPPNAPQSIINRAQGLSYVQQQALDAALESTDNAMSTQKNEPTSQPDARAF